jgi:hypothetical protein
MKPTKAFGHKRRGAYQESLNMFSSHPQGFNDTIFFLNLVHLEGLKFIYLFKYTSLLSFLHISVMDIQS